jgi:hypothetical protein
MDGATSAQVAQAVAAAAVQAGQDTPTVRGADWQTATVTAVNTDGTVSCGTAIRARRLESYQLPTVGDRIMLTRSGTGSWLAVGRTATAAVALGIPRHVYKTNPTDRLSTTTFADDPDLTMQLSPNSVNLIEFHLFVGGPSGGLMVTQWTTPADASGLKGVQGPGSAATDNSADNITGRFGSHGFGTTITYGRRGSANTNLLYAVESGVLTTTTGGTCAVAWAQALSTATATRMGVSSWMRVTRLS